MPFHASSFGRARRGRRRPSSTAAARARPRGGRGPSAARRKIARVHGVVLRVRRRPRRRKSQPGRFVPLGRRQFVIGRRVGREVSVGVGEDGLHLRVQPRLVRHFTMDPVRGQPIEAPVERTHSAVGRRDRGKTPFPGVKEGCEYWHWIPRPLAPPTAQYRTIGMSLTVLLDRRLASDVLFARERDTKQLGRETVPADELQPCGHAGLRYATGYRNGRMSGDIERLRQAKHSRFLTGSGRRRS